MATAPQDPKAGKTATRRKRRARAPSVEPRIRFSQGPLHAVLIERHLNGRVELALLEWLDEITERLDFACLP